ncbi:MAG TPA: methionine aminotransferase [Castellaniella sp.]|uniref:methionine aminotransferase n=1 Tax=Castellaniella sp. TaxID=1955812 RepID=UPI002F04FE53
MQATPQFTRKNSLIQSKLPAIGDTIFSEMSELAKETNAINLGQGFPDYQPDPRLLDAVADALRNGSNQYAPMTGLPELRQVIADKVYRQHRVRYSTESEITVTSGASEALMSSFQALIHPGDEVLLIDPSYDLYAPAVTLAGGKIVRIAMQAPTSARPEFVVDWDALNAAFTSKTRALVLNFPHNPTGVVLHEADLDTLEDILARHPKCLIVSDEAYEHIIFDGEEQHSVVRRPALQSRTVLISSFGKSLHATGWKIGYFCAPADLTAEIRKVHQFVVYSVNTPMQAGIARYLRNQPQVLDALPKFYQSKRDLLANGLSATCLKPLRSSGTFFLVADTSALGSHLEKDLAIQLTREVGVASIPVSAFYPDSNAPEANHSLLRLCFAKEDATLEQAVEKLSKLKPC